MNKLLSKTQFAIAASTALAFSACQTAPISSIRTPASAVDPKHLAMVERDAIETVGLFSHQLILTKISERILLGRQLVEAQYQPFNGSSIVGDTVGMLAAGALVGFSFQTSNKTTKKTISLRMGIGAAAASLIIGTVTFTTQSYGKGSFDGSSVAERGHNSASSFDPQMNSFGFYHKTFRNEDVRKIEQGRADAVNAVKQAEFIKGLKATAQESARRAGLLFRLNAMEISQFEFRIEDRLRDAFQAQKIWKPGDEIRIDVQNILRAIVPDADQRIFALGEIVSAAGDTKVSTPNSDADLIEWLEATERTFRGLEREIVADYRKNREERDPKLQSIIKQYEVLGNEIDEFAKKLALHAKMIRDGKQP